MLSTEMSKDERIRAPQPVPFLVPLTLPGCVYSCLEDSPCENGRATTVCMADINVRDIARCARLCPNVS
jgi:hypothetical protein